MKLKFAKSADQVGTRLYSALLETQFGGEYVRAVKVATIARCDDHTLSGWVLVESFHPAIQGMPRQETLGHAKAFIEDALWRHMAHGVLVR